MGMGRGGKWMATGGKRMTILKPEFSSYELQLDILFNLTVCQNVLLESFQDSPCLS